MGKINKSHDVPALFSFWNGMLSHQSLLRQLAAESSLSHCVVYFVVFNDLWALIDVLPIHG